MSVADSTVININQTSPTSKAELIAPENKPLGNRQRILFIRSQYIGLLVTILNLIVSLLSARSTEAKIGMALSTSNVLNILSFLVLMWRYSTNLNTEACACTANKKERQALIALGIIFMLSSGVIIFNGIFKIANLVLPSDGLLAILFSFLAFLSYTALSVWNFFFSKKTKINGCLNAACLISSVSSISSLSASLAMIIFIRWPTKWYFDECIGFVVAFFLILYGLRLFFNICIKKC